MDQELQEVLQVLGVVLLEQDVVQLETMLQQIQVVEQVEQEILPHLQQVMVVQE